MDKANVVQSCEDSWICSSETVVLAKVHSVAVSKFPKLIRSRYDFIIDPPPALFGTTGQMPKISLALVALIGKFQYHNIQRVRHLSSGIIESVNINLNFIQFIRSAAEISDMYVRYLRILKDDGPKPSAWLSAVISKQKPILKWYDSINLEQKNVDAFAAWTEIQCTALGVDFGDDQTWIKEKT